MQKLIKYIGMDVHKAMTVIAVLDAAGKMLAQATIQTQAATILAFIGGLEGVLYVTLEESTYSAWLHDLLSPHVVKVVVCDPRRNASYFKSGNKSDQIDAHKLADLLRCNMLNPVYHGHASGRMLKELARSYLALVDDLTRVMNRLKALYRGRGIACGGQRVYSALSRSQWLEQLREPGVRARAELLYRQLDALAPLRREARQALLLESRRHPAAKSLRSVPGLGPVRVALLLALMQTPHRFRGKRPLWAYAGLAIVTWGSSEYCLVEGRIQRSKRAVLIRGLNRNYQHDLKNVFKGAATTVLRHPGPLQQFYASRVAQGMKPQLALLTLARKIAVITLTVWKKGGRFDAAHLKTHQAA
jgi:transposase